MKFKKERKSTHSHSLTSTLIHTHPPTHTHTHTPAGAAWDVQPGGPRRGDARDGGEDDVRPKTKANGTSHVWRNTETGNSKEIYGTTPGNGFLKCKDWIKTKS